MRPLLGIAGWLLLIGLFGLSFISDGNRVITASLQPDTSPIQTQHLYLPAAEKSQGRNQKFGHIPSTRSLSVGIIPVAAAEMPAAESAPQAGADILAMIMSSLSRENEGTAIKPSASQDKPLDSVHEGSQAASQLHRRLVDRLQIPALRVNVLVVEVPFVQYTWNLNAIQQEVAQLGSLPGEQEAGKLVLAGHVTLYNGSHGPFRYLHWLRPGDEIIVEEGRTRQVFRVQEQIVVRPEDLSVIENSTLHQLVLLTCTDWSEELELYQRRRVILADLVKTEPIVDRKD